MRQKRKIKMILTGAATFITAMILCFVNVWADGVTYTSDGEEYQSAKIAYETAFNDYTDAQAAEADALAEYNNAVNLQTEAMSTLTAAEEAAQQQMTIFNSLLENKKAVIEEAYTAENERYTALQNATTEAENAYTEAQASLVEMNSELAEQQALLASYADLSQSEEYLNYQAAIERESSARELYEHYETEHAGHDETYNTVYQRCNTEIPQRIQELNASLATLNTQISVKDAEMKTYLNNTMIPAIADFEADSSEEEYYRTCLAEYTVITDELEALIRQKTEAKKEISALGAEQKELIKTVASEKTKLDMSRALLADAETDYEDAQENLIVCRAVYEEYASSINNIDYDAVNARIEELTLAIEQINVEALKAAYENAVNTQNAEEGTFLAVKFSYDTSRLWTLSDALASDNILEYFNNDVELKDAAVLAGEKITLLGSAQSAKDDADNIVGTTYTAYSSTQNASTAALENMEALRAVFFDYQRFCDICGKEVFFFLDNGETSMSDCQEVIKDGYPTHICNDCWNAINTHEHDWVLESVDAASCESDGTEHYRCRTCQEEMEKTILATGHDYRVSESQDETCTEPGFIIETCNKCGKEVRTEVPAPGHDMHEISRTDPTCTENGVVTYRCSRCEYEEIEHIAAEGHTYEDEVVAPTYSTRGYTIHTCTKCRESYMDTYVRPLTLAKPEIRSVSTTNGGVQIRWKKVTGAVRYTILRSTDTSSSQAIAVGEVDGDKYSFVDTVCSGGVLYYYWVKATTADGAMKLSNISDAAMRINVPATYLPKQTDEGVLIRWAMVSGATSYRIYRREGDGTFIMIAEMDGTAYTDDTAERGKTYCYVVRGVNGTRLGTFAEGYEITIQ